MFHIPGYYLDLSEKLSSVLEDVGVNERLVLKRRNFLLVEEMKTIELRISGNNASLHYFGSQSEGTTTRGLNSDLDIMICNNDVNVIEDWADWKAGTVNLMMIQDENVPPGYCMLQVLDANVPQPLTDILNEHQVKLCENMVVLKYSFLDKLCPIGNIKNGPSFTSLTDGYDASTDQVIACPCRTMPRAVGNWIQAQMLHNKLLPGMKKYIERNPCYIVPVGNKSSSHEWFEWRISTSHAERCLMFNLNITQIRCYIIMKMILKSILKHPDEQGLSSFMCKNILLLCIEHTPSEPWSASDLMTMLTLCLFELQKCLINKHCPHFIERRNNLMGRRFTRSIHEWLREQVKVILHSNGRSLLDITIDDLGRRLQSKLNLVYNTMNPNVATPDEISRYISGSAMYRVAIAVSFNHCSILDEISSGRKSWTDIFQILDGFSFQESIYAQVSCRLLQKYLFSNFGCVLASNSLQQHNAVSSDAQVWLYAGLNSDVAFGRLKLASVLYAVWDFDSVYDILRVTEEMYDTGLVAAACYCYKSTRFFSSERFDVYAENHNDVSVSNIIACCVRFLPSEINCIPRELQYELFRFSKYDRLHKGELDYWMDFAVVDSLPYLYFLQYKTFGYLQRHDDQQRAIRKLINILYKNDENFGHRDTAFNLLGQCMVQEGSALDAFQCYVNSRNIRPRNNAANYHICRLLYRIICSQTVQK